MPEAYEKLCQTSKMMSHIENPGIIRTVYSGIFRQTYLRTFSNIQPCSGQYSAMFKRIEGHQRILKHIQALLWHIKTYSDIFRTLCNPCIYTVSYSDS